MRSSRESRGEKKMRWIRRRKSEDTEMRARREEKRVDMRVSGDKEDKVRLR